MALDGRVSTHGGCSFSSFCEYRHAPVHAQETTRGDASRGRPSPGSAPGANGTRRARRLAGAGHAKQLAAPPSRARVRRPIALAHRVERAEQGGELRPHQRPYRNGLDGPGGRQLRGARHAPCPRPPRGRAASSSFCRGSAAGHVRKVPDVRERVELAQIERVEELRDRRLLGELPARGRPSRRSARRSSLRPPDTRAASAARATRR